VNLQMVRSLTGLIKFFWFHCKDSDRPESSL
jgi:hypothetical protein